MTAPVPTIRSTQASPPVPSAPSGPSGVPEPRGRAAELGSTVKSLRMRAALLTLLIIAFAIAGSVAGWVSRSATAAAKSNTAPSLVGVQDLFASVAESNTAATAAFLSAVPSGEENRLQRNLYEDALRRASDSAEDVSSLVGDDAASHAALKDISARLNEYSGEIEAARLAAQLEQPNAEAGLRNALVRTQTEIDGSVQLISTQLQSQLDERSGEGRTLTIIAIVLGVLCLVALAAVQVFLFESTNRVFNLPLLLGTILILLTTIALVRGALVRQAAIDNALEGGYNSITNTAEIQRAAYALQSESNLRLLGTSSADLEELEVAVDMGIIRATGNADSVREQAAATELQARWNRYLATPADDPNLKFANFNGLNTSIESVLSDNTAQFNAGVDSAADAVQNAGIYVLVGSILALMASLYGLQLRLREYS